MTQIRQVNQKDISTVEQMQAAWRSEYDQYDPWDSSFLIKGIGSYFLLAEQNGEIVGYILADDRRHNPNFLDVIIHDLYVKQAFRRTGTGEHLLRAILEQARNDKAAVCRLTPSCDHEDLDQLAAFYERQGFVWEDNQAYMALLL